MNTYAVTYRVEIGKNEFAVQLIDAENFDNACNEADAIFGARFVEIERVI